jgi:hypothetical protein
VTGIRNPRVECPTCGRWLTSNLIGRHVAAHDPAVREARRIHKNGHQRSYHQSPAGRMTRRRWTRSPRGLAGARRREERWRRTEQGRKAHSAHTAVYVALRDGRLVRKPCRICGDPKAFAHHPNGYEGIHRLDVEWLCLTHHMEAHGRVAA